MIEGALTVDGAPAPDGVGVILIFVGGGGLNEVSTSGGGRYEFGTLKRVCEDGTFYVPFTIYAGSSTATVLPASDHETLDLNAIDPPIPPEQHRECALQFGRLSGEVADAGEPVLVTVTSVPGAGNLEQQVFTVDGRYEVTSIGFRCSDGESAYLPMTVTAGDGSVAITPRDADEQADLGQ